VFGKPTWDLEAATQVRAAIASVPLDTLDPVYVAEWSCLSCFGCRFWLPFFRPVFCVLAWALSVTWLLLWHGGCDMTQPSCPLPGLHELHGRAQGHVVSVHVHCAGSVFGCQVGAHVCGSHFCCKLLLRLHAAVGFTCRASAMYWVLCRRLVNEHSLAFPVSKYQLMALCSSYLVNERCYATVVKQLKLELPVELVRAVESKSEEDDIPAAEPFLRECAEIFVYAKRRACLGCGVVVCFSLVRLLVFPGFRHCASVAESPLHTHLGLHARS